MLVYNLTTPFLVSPLDVVKLCQTCKYLHNNENEYYLLYLLQLREIVNDHFVEIFNNQRLIPYDYVGAHDQLIQFLNYNKLHVAKYSWKTCFMLFFLNFSIYPNKEHPYTKMLCENDDISLLLPINVLKTKLSQYTKNYLKYQNNLLIYKNKLNNTYREYIRKIEHVNILANQLPSRLKILQNEFSHNIIMNQSKTNIQDMCRKILSKYSVIRNVQNEIDVHIKTLERRALNARLAEKKMIFFDDIITLLNKYQNLYVYNVNKDNNKCCE